MIYVTFDFNGGDRIMKKKTMTTLMMMHLQVRIWLWVVFIVVGKKQKS